MKKCDRARIDAIVAAIGFRFSGDIKDLFIFEAEEWFALVGKDAISMKLFSVLKKEVSDKCLV